MQRKIKENRHKTLSPASVNKSVDKVAGPFKFHYFLHRQMLFA